MFPPLYCFKLTQLTSSIKDLLIVGLNISSTLVKRKKIYLIPSPQNLSNYTETAKNCTNETKYRYIKDLFLSYETR